MRISLILSLLIALPAFSADFAGTWKVKSTDPEGRVIQSKLVVRDANGTLGGEVLIGANKIPLKEAKVEGDKLVIKLVWDVIPLTVKLSPNGENKLKGTFETENGDSGPVEAEKDITPAAAATTAANGGTLAGKWTLNLTAPSGEPLKIPVTFAEADGKWTGEVVMPNGQSRAFSEVKPVEDKVVAKIVSGNGEVVIEFEAKGETRKGKVTMPDGNGGPITLTR